MLPEDIEKFTAFLKEFQSESDRGAALVGAATIDHRLSDILRAFLYKKKATTRLIEGASAPLGTFSSRIDATAALGLITDHEESEFHLIRKIRNEFAHRNYGTDFTDKKIALLCDRLKSDLPGGKDGFIGRPRAIFVNAVVVTSLALTYRADNVAAVRWDYMVKSNDTS